MAGPAGQKISAVLIVKDAESTLDRTLESLAFCDEIVVVDSGSTDATRTVARSRGASLYERPFDDFASQKNYAVSLATWDWVLSVDADEVVTPELRDEIRSLAEPLASAYRIPRRTVFLGRTLRFGGHQTDRPLRLFRRSEARFVGQVHEVVETPGPLGELRSHLTHHTTRSVREYLAKLNHYTDLEARTLTESAIRVPATGRGLILRPAGRFVQKYLLQGGFADGWGGFVYASLSAYYEHVRWAKFWRNSKSISANM